MEKVEENYGENNSETENHSLVTSPSESLNETNSVIHNINN